MAKSKISEREALNKLQDLSIPEHELAQLVELDPVHSDGFSIALKFKPDEVELGHDEGAKIVGAFNRISRWRRQQIYKKRVKRRPNDIRIVSEGDSWFQYPFILDDVIDHLGDTGQYRYAIYSLGAAGDLLRDMSVKDEITEAIQDHRPKVLLLSGGGNDMVGDERMATMVTVPTKKPAKASDYLNAEFERFVDEIEQLYRDLFQRYLHQQPHLKIVIHGYDYAIPDDGVWLGKPLSKAKVTDVKIQREIVALMIDRFNAVLQNLQSEFVDSVFYVDVRNVVGKTKNQWHDELHPTSKTFAKVATKFDKVIQQALNHTTIKTHGESSGFTDLHHLTTKDFTDLVYTRAKQTLGDGVKLPTNDKEREQLESELNRYNEKLHLERDFLPISFLETGVKRAHSVCKIVTHTSMGSGFMFATRQFIMTNNHVIPDRMTASQSTALFDYDQDSQQFPVALDPDRLFITNQALDFTIVALADHQLPATIEAIPFTRNPGQVTRNERVNIIQHPQGRRKEVSLHDNKVTYVYDNVIQYRADTEPGSSGSPVFNNQWQLVALHHRGWSEGNGMATNQGVRMSAIVDYLLNENQQESAALFEAPAVAAPVIGKPAMVPQAVSGSSAEPELVLRGNLKGVTLKFE